MIAFEGFDYIVCFEDGDVLFFQTFEKAFNYCLKFPHHHLRIYTLTDVLEREDNCG